MTSSKGRRNRMATSTLMKCSPTPTPSHPVRGRAGDTALGGSASWQVCQKSRPPRPHTPHLTARGGAQPRSRLPLVGRKSRTPAATSSQKRRSLTPPRSPPPARVRARDVMRPTVTDKSGYPLFDRASQCVAAATLLARQLPEPATPEQQQVQQGLKTLLERAANQQAESSAGIRGGSQSHSSADPRG